MARVFVHLCLVLTVLALPGVTEMVENVVHLASHGHPAHAAEQDGAAEAADHDDEHSTDPEHGCVGDIHVCSCCGHVVVAVISSTLSFELEALPYEKLESFVDSHRAVGVQRPVFRPPIA